MNIPPSTVPMRLRVKDAAGYTGLSASTLNKYRLNGHGPPVHQGRSSLYRLRNQRPRRMDGGTDAQFDG